MVKYEEIPNVWDVKNCPFCGKSMMKIGKETNGKAEAYFVECFYCGARSGKESDKEEAVVAWEERFGER